MTICLNVLRWVYRRDQDAIICELGLNSDESAYELRLQLPAAIGSRECFHDVTAAFNRHIDVERGLIRDGWSLDAFESSALERGATAPAAAAR